MIKLYLIAIVEDDEYVEFAVAKTIRERNRLEDKFYHSLSSTGILIEREVLVPSFQ